MPSIPLLPHGQRKHFTQSSFAVLTVALRPIERNKLGSIDKLLFLQKIINANGKNFTIANAIRFGGRGAAIVPLRI
jgi:hypothetical protein